jgi:hypothetical protein
MLDLFLNGESWREIALELSSQVDNFIFEASMRSMPMVGVFAGSSQNPGNVNKTAREKTFL